MKDLFREFGGETGGQDGQHTWKAGKLNASPARGRTHLLDPMTARAGYRPSFRRSERLSGIVTWVTMHLEGPTSSRHTGASSHAEPGQHTRERTDWLTRRRPAQ